MKTLSAVLTRWMDLASPGRVTSARFRLGFAACATLGLTYVLLSPDPWWFVRWLRGDAARVLQHGVSDKMYHVLGYLTLTLSLMWWASARIPTMVWLSAAAAGGHAVVTELLQYFVPGRTVDRADFVANLAGVACGFCAGTFLRWLRGLPRERTAPALSAVRPVSSPVTRPPSPSRAESPSRTQVKSLPESPASPADGRQWRRMMKAHDAPVTGGDAPAGLSRSQLTPDEAAEMRPRIFNYRFAGILVATGGVFFSSVYAIHGWQMRQNAGALIERGERARDSGDVGQAREYFSRYVGMVPNDVNALATLGVLIDDSAESPAALRQVFAIYEDVLRSDPTREDVRRRQIETAVAMGRYSDALAHVRILRQVYSTDARLALKAGICHQELGEFAAAEEAFRQAIEFAPNLIPAWSRLARLLDEQDEHDAAVELLDRLIEQNGSRSDAWLVRAEFRQKHGELDSAAEDMSRALDRGNEGPRLWLAASRLYYDRIAAARMRGQIPRAERLLHQARRILRDALTSVPDDVELRLQAILLESHFGDQEQALTQLSELQTQRGGDPRTHLLLADLLIERGAFEQARKTLALLPRTPGSDALRLFLDGRMAMAQERWEHALNVLREARRYQVESPAALERTDLAMAACFREQGDTEAEITTLRQVLKYQVSSVPARLALAAALLRQQDLGAAIAEYRQLSSMPEVRLLLVRLLILQNLQVPEVARDWREAEVLLREARDQSVPPSQLVLLEAELLAARGRLNDARQLLEQAQTSQAEQLEFLVALSQLARQAGDSQRAAFWMGRALAGTGNLSAAESEFRKVLGEAPHDTVAARSLMDVLIADGRREEAVTIFRQYAPRMSTTELAQTYALFGDHARAAELLQREAADSSEALSALDSLASIYLQHDMLPQARSVLERLVKGSEPTSTLGRSARRQLALLLSSSGDFRSRQRALKLLQENEEAAGSLAVDDIRTHAAVLASSSMRADRAKAVELLESLDDQQLLLPRDRWLLARLYEAENRNEEASRQFQIAVDQGNTSERLLADYTAHLVMHAGRPLAEQWLTRFRTQYPRSAEVLRLEARLLVRYAESAAALKQIASHVDAATSSGDRVSRLLWAADVLSEAVRGTDRDGELISAAQRYLTEAVSLQPQAVVYLASWLVGEERDVEAFELLDDLWEHADSETAGGLSLAMLAGGPTSNRLASVESHLKRAVQQDPGSTALKVFLADVKSLQEQYDTAETLYRQVLHVAPENTAALNNLAWLLGMRERETEEALALVERAISLAGPLPHLLDTRGCILLSNGRARHAVGDLRTASDEEPGTATTLLHLAVAEFRSGHVERARETRQQAVAAGLSETSLHPLDRQLLHSLDEEVAVPTTASPTDV